MRCESDSAGGQRVDEPPGDAGRVGDGGADHDGVEKATVIIDEQAAAKLRLADEYRHTWANKPSWQSWR